MKRKNKVASWSEKELQKLYDLKNVNSATISEVAAIMGRSYDSIKCKIRRLRPTWKGAPKAHAVASEENAQERNYSNEVNEAISKSKFDLQKKNDYKIYNELLRQQASSEIVIEKLTSAVEAIPFVDIEGLSKYKLKPTKKDACEDAVLLIGDLHCGNCVLPEETLGLGDYNMQIFSQRMDKMTNSVCQIVDLHRNLYNIKRLHIFCLGDLVQGMNAAGKWSPVHIEQDILTQVFLCMDKFAQQLAVWSNCFNEVKFYGVYGNHGRASLRGVEKDFVNWDYVMYKFLEAKAQNYKNVEFHVGKSWMQIAQVQNTKFLLVHGDDIKGTMGIPFYGIQRAEGRYRSLLEQFKTKNEAYTICKPYIEKVNKNPESIDAAFELIQAVMIYTKSFDNLVLGHIHNAASWHTNAGGKVIVNGAFYGGDVHSIKQLQSANPPVQKFFGVNSKGLTWQYDLELDRK